MRKFSISTVAHSSSAFFATSQVNATYFLIPIFCMVKASIPAYSDTEFLIYPMVYHACEFVFALYVGYSHHPTNRTV